MLDFKFIGLIASLLTGDPITDTQLKVNEIKGKPAPRIQPIPDFDNNVVAAYNAEKYRNPFHSQALHREISSYVPKKVYVDPNRMKQPLEAFPLNQLVMTGVLKKGRNFDVMIRTPDGHLIVAGLGDYIGENHGRIKRINPEGIEIAEAVDDGVGGFIEQPRILALLENQKVDGI